MVWQRLMTFLLISASCGKKSCGLPTFEPSGAVGITCSVADRRKSRKMGGVGRGRDEEEQLVEVKVLSLGYSVAAINGIQFFQNPAVS